MPSNKKIALTGGGTLGHVTPNLALVPELKKQNFDIIYIGSKDKTEKLAVDKYNIPFFSITSDKLRRYPDIKNLKMPINVIRGIIEARNILKKEKVDIVFSKGGFVSLPVVIAAKNLKIPVISHEADYTPGLANTISTPFSTKVCTNFLETSTMIKNNKGVYTGCPIRPKILSGSREKGLELLNFKNDKPIILVIGGSLGSVHINNSIRNNLDKLLEKYNIVHSCGKNKIDMSFKKKYMGTEQINPFLLYKNESGESFVDKIDGYRQFEIIKEELKDIYKATDIIISRAGANVIFEILALTIPNLLIPLPLSSSRGDQILNAKSFEKQGFSIVLTEEEDNKNQNLILDKIEELYKNKNQFINNMKNANLFNANEKIVKIISEYV